MARLYVNTHEGKKRKALYAHSRVEAASKLARAIAERDGRPLTAEPSMLPMRQFFAEWLAAKETELAPDTHRCYATIVRTHLTPLGMVPLSDLKRSHVEALKSRLGKKLEPSTVAHVMAVLSSAMGWAVALDLIDVNPLSGVKRPTERRSPMRSLSELEAAALMEAVRGTRREAMYLVALKLGPRAGEIRALRWPNIDQKAKTLTIEHSVSTQHRVIWGPPKGGESRTLALSEGICKAFEAHRELQRLERAAARRSWEDPALVFPNERGGVFRHQGMHKFFKRDLQKAGLPKEIRFHDMRHTAGTLMLRAGTPVHVVSKILGHADPAMTLRRYSHALPDMQETAARAMDSYQF